MYDRVPLRCPSIYPTGALHADFEGPDEGGPITVAITDLRAATSLGAGIKVHRGRKQYASYREADEAAWATIAKMTGHTVEELKSGEFYSSRR
jgi:hypothetical protein